MTLTPASRTRLLEGVMALAFLALLIKGGLLAMSGAGASTVQSTLGSSSADYVQRADIVDRNGEQLATSVTVHSLWADPSQIWDADQVARELVTVFPDLNPVTLANRLSNEDAKFVWVKRGLTPRQRQIVFELGLEGLAFEKEVSRAYPRGTLAGHVLGYAGLDGNGLAGIEYSMEAELAAGEAPVRLTIDNSIQAAVEAELSSAAISSNSKGAAAVLMDARTGEVRALASWPPIDPNRVRDMDAEDPAHLNRATSAVYELGSVFKPLTVAAAIEAGAIKPSDVFDVREPIVINNAKISDDHPIYGRADVTKILSESSNIGTVKVNMMLGSRRQRAFFESVGLFDRAPVEIAGSAAPLLPERWDDLTSATTSYGHGIAVTPMAFVSAFSALANGGERAQPTVIYDPDRHPKLDRVMSAVTADIVGVMLRESVKDGTGRRAEVAGYSVAGKTGTAEKPIAGGYSEDRNITSFAAIFPQDRPQYALIVTLDEPQSDDADGVMSGETAAFNAAPAAGRMIERVAPLLGLAPRFDETPRPNDVQIRSVSMERNAL